MIDKVIDGYYWIAGSLWGLCTGLCALVLYILFERVNE